MLHHVELHVRDLERSIAFCEDPDRIKLEVAAPSER